MNYIMIEENGKTTVLTFSNNVMNKTFTPKQIKMLRQRKTIICNSHHGNDWVTGMNATACDMEAIAKHHMRPVGK